MLKKFRITIKTIALFSILSSASWICTNASEVCQLTDEYKEARKEIGKLVYGDESNYRRCQNSVSNYDYWKAYSKCAKNGGGKNVGGGCAHLAGRAKYFQVSDVGHCEIFKFEPTPELAQSMLEETVKAEGIKKCIK